MKTNKNCFVECPRCLGEGKHYSPLEDDVIDCKLCDGECEISQKLADTYDPIADELTDLIFKKDKTE
jgi:hypothetical protein